MKITIEHYDDKITFETSDQSDLQTLKSALEGMLRAMGYARKSIEDIFKEDL